MEKDILKKKALRALKENKNTHEDEESRLNFNEDSDVFTKEVKRITKANGAEVIDKATMPQSPIKPNKVMNVAIATVLGVMIGLFLVFLLEYMDTKMKKPEDITKHLELPILGVIPNEDVA
jgi:capsular polysaccharide biosynthesis protein